MDEKVLKLLERALAENLSDERVSYIMGVNGYDQGSIDAALGELKKKRPSTAQPSERAGAPAASTASPSAGAPRVAKERVPSALPTSEVFLAPNLRKAFGEVPAESSRPIPQKPGPQIEYIEDKKGNVVARDKRTGEVTYSDTPTLSPEARQQVEERVLSGQVQTAPVQKPEVKEEPIELPTPEITVGDWFGDKWNGLIEGLEGFVSNLRTEASLNGNAIADFIEDNKSSKPEFYDLYEKNLNDAISRGYEKDFARGLAANAAYMEFWRKDNKIENEIVPYIKQSGREDAIRSFGVEIDKSVERELQSRLFSSSVRGLTGSLPSIAADAATMGMSFFDEAYRSADETLAMTLAENPDLNMTQGQQEAYKLSIGALQGILNKFGLSNLVKGTPMLQRAITAKVLSRLAGLGGEVGSEAFEKIVKEEVRGLGGYVRKVAAGALSEFETGTLQQLSNDLINNYVTDSAGKNVFSAKGVKEIISDAIYAGAQEAIGGGLIASTIAPFQKPGLDMTKEEFDLGINFAQNIKTERVAEYLDKQVADGTITEDEAKSTLNRVQEFKDAAAKIPEELTDQAKYQIFQLIAQKQGLQKNVAGKDEAIQERVKQKVDAINQQIQEVYDSQTQQPVSGTVQAGEIVGQVFQQGTSSEKTAPSGVLQTPQAEVEPQFFQPVFTVDPAGRAVVSPEKDNSTVSSIGNIRPTAEISEEDAAEMNRIFNVAKNAVDKDSKVVVHNSLESLLNSNPAAAQMYVDGKGTAKAYWNNSTNEFHVLSRTAVEQYNAATGSDISYAKQYVHEVVHPIVNTLITEDAEVQGRLFTEIEEMANKGNALAQRAVRFGKKYAEGKQQNETVTEFFALVAQPDGLKNFDRSFKQKLKDFFNEIFVRMGVDIKLESDQDLYTMARNIDLATRTGKSVVFPKTNAAYQARSIQASLDSTPAGSRLFNEPLEGVDEVIQDYMTKNNLPYRKGKKIFKLDKERAKQIGQAYDAMRNDPTDPEVKKAYDAMAKETIAQYEAILERGYKVEINNEEPYNNSQEMIEDLRSNKTMRIFSTEAGFGDTPITDDQRAENPLLRDSGYTDSNGNVLLVNDVFRFVHDFFGHAERGNSFGPLGEENAWDAHSRMYTPLARKAMTSETRGQNSWVNFSGVNDEAFKLRDKARKLREEGRTEEAKQLVGQVYEMMRFAEQKIGLLPDAFVTNDYDEIQFSTDQEAVIRDGKETVKFANSNPEFAVGTRAKVREMSYAERVLEKNPMFMFTGVEKIREAADVAFLFRHLESAVSENAFVTYHNPLNGDFRVQWLGTGGTTSAIIDTKLIAAAYQNFAEDLGTSDLVITLVHNHPTGALKPSKADGQVLSQLRDALADTGAEIADGIIINLDSGYFTRFSSDVDYRRIETLKTLGTEQEVPYETYSFNRQILYTPSSERTQVVSFNDVAAFLSKLKRGRHEKLGYFVLNNQNQITYSAIVDPNAPMKIKMRDVVADVGRYGESIIIFGTDEAKVKSMRQQASNRLKPMNASVLDAVIIKDSKDFLDAESVGGGSLSVVAKDTIDFSLDDIPSVTIDSPNSIKNAISFASESAFSNKLDFKAALQDRFKSYEKEIKKQYGIKSFETYDNTLANYLVDSYINETLVAIQSYPDALGWYDAKTKAAMATMSLIHPELESDVAAQAAFKIAVAVTSNGNKVFDNFKEADRQYKYYKKYGKFDSKYSIGTQSKGIKDTFKFTNMVLDKMSMENFATFLTSKFNAGDLKYIKGGKKTPLLSGFTVDTEVYGASIFGAKIGNGFFMNLYGQFDQLTMDRWFMRQYGRLTGTLLDIDPVKIKSGKVRLNQALRSLTASEKKTLASVIPDYKSFNVVELSHAINKASIKKDKRDMLSSTPALDELRKAGNSLSKNSSGEVEAPSGGNQRKFIVGVFNEVQRRLREDAGIEITIADLQAVNWYPEKALYQTFQEGREEADGATETSDNEQPDYESAAKRLAIENGITEEQIKNATRKQPGEPARESVARRAEQLTGDGSKPSVEQLSRAILNVKSGEEDGETYFSVDEGGIDWFVSPEGKGDPAISRRDAQLEEAAQELRDGKITNDEFRQMVTMLSPVEPITKFFAPATQERMASALSKDKVPSLNAPVKEAQTVALRLDIPAYINSNTWVVSVHDGTKNDGKVVSYQNVARITDVVFKSNPLAALNIAAGQAKSTIGRMFGKYAALEGKNPDERAESAKSIVSKIWNSPEWKQIGMNPTRASYFYDRKTARPVVAAEEVIQIGGLVYAKNPVYTKLNDPRFEVKGYNDADGSPVYFSVDEGASNLRQTISRTINRFSPETRARVMNNPKAYYSKQSLNAIKDNLDNMTDDELLENMTADGLNTISRTGAAGRSENDISVLAAIELINRKVEAGEDVSELLVDLSALGTTVGRMLRHFAELKSSSPMGIVETIRAALKRADRVMTPTQEDRLTQIASRFIAAQQKAKELRDKIELVYSAEQEAELKKAMTELDKVTRELNLFTSIIVPKKTMDLLSTTIQGNLLTPISQVTNVGANLVQMVTSIPVKGFETLFSKITSAFTGKAPRSFSASVTAMPYALKQAGVGVVEAFEIILKGGASSDKIVHTGFMPGAALLAALSDTKFASVVNATFGKEVIKGDVLSRLANGKIAPADRAKAVYEGLLGAAPEVMFRFLSLGDKPFFRFSEAMQLAQEANKLGLKGDARRNFMKYPSKKAMAAAQKAGQTVTFQQDNQAANLIFSIQKQTGKLPLVGPMIEFMMKVSLPYVKTPANIFSETMKFALPAYGVATATDKFFKKDFEGGSSDLAKAAVGQMIIAAANYLIANGIISAAFDDEDEGERAIAYLKQPPATLNKDALGRLIAGEDPAYRDGDRIIRYDKLGIPGMVLGARANAVKRAGGKPDEDGYYVGEEGMFKPAQFIWDQMSMPISTLQFMNEQSFLAGTNSLLNVLSGEASERDVEKWMENTFRALTAVPFPNTLSAIHRGQREYMPSIKSDNVLTKFRYVLMDRMFDVDGIPVKVDPLGAKIPQTPEGANSWYYNLVDFTKSAKTKDDMVWNELWSVYQATEEADVAPKFPTKLTYLPSETPEGIKIKGWNAKVEEEWRREMQRIQEIHGQGKREMLENLFNSNSYKQATNEQKAEMIVDLYSDYNRGQRTIKAPFGRMPSLKPRFEWKQEYEKVEQKYLE
jgi:DNA repair protein RadC